MPLTVGCHTHCFLGAPRASCGGCNVYAEQWTMNSQEVVAYQPLTQPVSTLWHSTALSLGALSQLSTAWMKLSHTRLQRFTGQSKQRSAFATLCTRRSASDSGLVMMAASTDAPVHYAFLGVPRVGV